MIKTKINFKFPTKIFKYVHAWVMSWMEVVAQQVKPFSLPHLKEPSSKVVRIMILLYIL